MVKAPFSFLTSAWRGGVRAWPIGAIMIFATLLMTPPLVIMQLWLLFGAPLTKFASGTIIIAGCLPTVYMAYAVQLVHCLPFRFMGNPYSIGLGIITICFSIVLIPVQAFFLWPGLTDGRAGVPFHTPLIDMEISDPFWPYLLMYIGLPVVFVSLLISLGAYVITSVFFFIVALRNSIPGIGWIISGVERFAHGGSLLPH